METQSPDRGVPVGSSFHQSTQFRVFPISTAADITIYQSGKIFYIFLLYNTKNMWEILRVDIELVINTALSQLY